MRRSILLFVSLILIAGCGGYNLDKTQLQGEWTDFTPQPGTMYFGGSELRIRFQNDSFYYHMNKWSDVELLNDTCAFYKEDRHAAGKFKVKDDKLLLNGVWTNNFYKTDKMSLCIESGPFSIIYEFEYAYEGKMELRQISPYIKDYNWLYRKQMVMVKQSGY